MTTGLVVPALLPADPGFAAEVAPFVTTRAVTPDLVVPARSAGDVAAAVEWAAAEGRSVSIQSTGHQMVSDLSGTVLVSTRGLDEVRVDPQARTVTVGGGARWSQVLTAAAPFGLAPPCGSSSQVGVAGFTLGGGHGHLSRRYGVAADHVRRLQMVTADGAVREVDAEREPDLFWAVRGGKAGFGVVTELEIALHPVAKLYGGGIFFPGEDAPALLHAWREWVDTLPEESTTSIALMRMPQDPALPPPLQGAFLVHLRFSHLGTAEDGAALLAPMRAIAPPMIDMVGEMPFSAVDAIHSEPTEPVAIWDDSATLGALPEEAIDALLAVAGPGVEIPVIMAELRHLGGAIARDPEVPNAVAGRDAEFALFALAPMAEPIAAIAPAAARSVVDALRPWQTGGLPNFQGQGSQGRLAGIWTDSVRERLLAVRDQVDPQGVFRAGLQLV